MTAALKVGIAGLGTVGAALIAQIASQRAQLTARCGRPIEIVAVCARLNIRLIGLLFGILVLAIIGGEPERKS